MLRYKRLSLTAWRRFACAVLQNTIRTHLRQSLKNKMTTTIQNSQELLDYLLVQSVETKQTNKELIKYLLAQSVETKRWFGFVQQKITGVNLAHEIAAIHADKMTPEQVTDYVIRLNNLIYQKIIRGDSNGNGL
jgi:hypothetical protein